MSNTTKPNELAKKDGGSVANQDSSKEYSDKTESGTMISVKVPDSPAANDETDKKAKDFSERLRTLLTALALGVSIWAVVVTSGSRDAARESAGAAKESAATARRNADIAEKGIKATIENFQLQQRPWITARVKWLRGVTVFDSGQTNASFRIEMKNIGHSVAVKVLEYTTVFLVSGEGIIGLERIDAAIARRDAMCEEDRRGSDAPGGGVVLFPEQRTYSDSETIIRSGSDLEGYTEFDPLTRTQVMRMMVIGCVTYQSVTSPQRHVTGFVYTLWATDYQQGLPVGKSIPANKLGLSPDTFAHAYID